MIKKIYLTIKEFGSFIAPLNFKRLITEIKNIWKEK